MSEQTFKIVLRGYDKDEVDKRISTLLDEVSIARQLSKKSTTELESLRVENIGLRQKIKSSSNLGFADLGSQFEQTLRIAEEQAKKLIADATQEATRIRETSNAEAEQAVRRGEAKGERAIAAAEQRIIDLNFQASTLENNIKARQTQTEQEAADIILQARQSAAKIISDTQLEISHTKNENMIEIEQLRISAQQDRNEAQEVLVQAQAKSAEILARAQAEIAADRAAVITELEELSAQVTAKRKEVDEMTRQIQQDRAGADIEIAEKRKAFELESNERYKLTVSQSEEIMKRADNILSEANSRANEITKQADARLQVAIAQADERLEKSRQDSNYLISESRRRSESLTARAEHYALKAIHDAEQRSALLKSEFDELSEFLESLKSMMSSEAFVSVIETSQFQNSRLELGAEALLASKEEPIDAEIVED